MSAFLSNKLLKYRGLMNQPRKPISEDLLCRGCGYNLRGLVTGGKCPECGRVIQLKEATRDMLIDGEIARRRLVMIGLTLLALCPLAAICLRVIAPIVCSLMILPPPDWLYTGAGAAIGLVWSIGVWLVTSRRLGAQHPRLAWLRLIARITQLLWAPAYIAWTVHVVSGALGFSPALQVFYLLGMPARLGAIALCAWLLVLAEDAELDDAAGNLNLCLWVVPLISVIVLLIPIGLPFFGQAIMLIVLAPWAWYLVKFAGSVWAMQRHVAWSIKESYETHDRDARIAHTRAAMQARVDANVRPLPPPAPAEDLPIIGKDVETADERG